MLPTPGQCQKNAILMSDWLTQTTATVKWELMLPNSEHDSEHDSEHASEHASGCPEEAKKVNCKD